MENAALWNHHVLGKRAIAGVAYHLNVFTMNLMVAFTCNAVLAKYIRIRNNCIANIEAAYLRTALSDCAGKLMPGNNRILCGMLPFVGMNVSTAKASSFYFNEHFIRLRNGLIDFIKTCIQGIFNNKCLHTLYPFCLIS